MKGTLTTAALALVTTLVVTSLAYGAGPTREEYVAQVDPICKENVDANKTILDGVSPEVKADKLKAAAKRFMKVSANFGKTIKAIEAIPRPEADNERLEKWFKFLKIVQTNLAKVGKALNEENKVKATHEKIRTERSSNASNNVSFVFGFKSCALKPSQFK